MAKPIFRECADCGLVLRLPDDEVAMYGHARCVHDRLPLPSARLIRSLTDAGQAALSGRPEVVEQSSARAEGSRYPSSGGASGLAGPIGSDVVDGAAPLQVRVGEGSGCIGADALGASSASSDETLVPLPDASSHGRPTNKENNDG